MGWIAGRHATALGFLLLLPRFVGAASFTVIDVPPGVPFIDNAMSLSADGTTVVGSVRESTFTSRAFVWNARVGFRLIDGLPDVQFGSVAFDVSANGRTILGSALDPNGRPQAFLAVIPEPGTGLLIGLGLGLLAWSVERGSRPGRTPLRSGSRRPSESFGFETPVPASPTSYGLRKPEVPSCASPSISTTPVPGPISGAIAPRPISARSASRSTSGRSTSRPPASLPPDRCPSPDRARAGGIWAT
ncbi:MAG: PEP-CTERM sorting domain-containing protein [Deltaproteobacteria bacterium]|nr:PEP-CTERM sorting domain-containing protein [Deltaproteobacteria bacterium]